MARTIEQHVLGNTTTKNVERINITFKNNTANVNCNSNHDNYHNSKVLYNLNELPNWQRQTNNQFIKTGYLRETNSYWSCISAIRSWNNQTLNIVINILTTLFYLQLLLFYTDLVLIPRFPTTTMTDYILLNIFFATGLQYSLVHALFQWFRIHSLEQYLMWGKMANLTIIYHLTSSTITLLYYCYYDNVFYFKLLSILTFTFMLLMCLATMTNFFQRTILLRHRGILFIVFGLCLVFTPLTFGVIIFGWDKVSKRINLNLLSVEISLYFLGALLYVIRAPERFFANVKIYSFNICYILIILASLIHWEIILQSFKVMRLGLDSSTLINFN